MFQFVKDFVKWAWAERSFLGPLFTKYRNLPHTGDLKFDGPALKEAIIKYEPTIYGIVSGGTTIRQAIIALIFARFGPRKMTQAEEKVFFDNASRLDGH